MDWVTGILVVFCLVGLFCKLVEYGNYTPPHRTEAYKRQFGSVRRQVLRRDGYRCQMCGVPLTSGRRHVHHRVPRSRGGTNAPSNLISLCPRCHGRVHGQEWR